MSKIIEMRRRKAERISTRLSETTETEVPYTPDGFFPVYQIYTIKVKRGQGKRDTLSTHLAREGIGARVYFPQFHSPISTGANWYRTVNCPVIERASNQVQTLSMYPTLTRILMDYITNMMADFFPRDKSR